MKIFQSKSPLFYLLLFYLLLSFLLRIVLYLHPITQTTFSFFDSLKIIFFGFLSDFFIFIIVSIFLYVYLIFLSDGKYLKPWGYIIFGCLVLLLSYISIFNTILNEYGGALPEIVTVFVSIKTILFGLLLFIPKYRKTIRLSLFSFTIFIFVLVVIQNAVSEFFFWNEFGVRYNFIAVDYLVYTNTVIGNIMESYPVLPLFVAIGIFTLLITFFIVKESKNYLSNLPSFTEKIKSSVVYFLLCLASIIIIPRLARQENSANIFKNELQANGIYKFYVAFMNSELDYTTFYKTIPTKIAYSILGKQIAGIQKNSSFHTVTANKKEIHKNVVLITIESLSADFLRTYGNSDNITPFLDSLATKSLLFTNIYAVGNRTVRGLEAVSLCIPPTAGESVVKRKDNINKFTTGSLFKKREYNVKYLYGGDAFFDNMQSFFGGNGYEIVDKKYFKENEISFSNVWGVCDEDMYKKAITIMNNEATIGKPFFNHIMTVSNHRPFTYPEKKINIVNTKSRNGGVKYTDFALQQFFKMAKKQSWYKNTVFVLVADHCASRSGKTELPLDKYRIPAMIFSDGFVEPHQFNGLMSQIDVMPTLFGLLNFTYQSKFYGQDVFDKKYKPRALIATYQNLGLIKDNVLTIISPKQQVKQMSLTSITNPKLAPQFQINYEQKEMKKCREDLINETITYYETASDMLKNKKFNQLN